MRKLLLNLFLSTVGLLFAGQASAQEEIAPGIIKLQAGEIDTFTPYSLFGGKPAVEARTTSGCKAALQPRRSTNKDNRPWLSDRSPSGGQRTNIRFRTSIRNFRSAWPGASAR